MAAGLAVVALGALAPRVLAHAVLTAASPARDAILASAPQELTLTFSEPISLLAGSNLDVVDEGGKSVAANPGRVSPRSARELELPLRRGLGEGTYTVRYNILSADAHVIVGSHVFGVGSGPLKAPVLTAGGGPGETSAWAVSARFLELVGLGGLLGLLTFRWLVWRPVLRNRWAVVEGEKHAAVDWASGNFWGTFAALGVVGIAAEGYLLLTKAAGALGKNVYGTLRDPAGVSQVMRETRFGDLIQIRSALLFGVLLIATWEFQREPIRARQALARTGSDASATGKRDRADGKPASGKARAPGPAGRPIPALLIVGFLVACLVLISLQGHASTAPFRALSVAVDAAHLAGVSVWLSGLALLGATYLRLPKAVGDEGPVLSVAVLTQFSRIAFVAIATAIATGVIRAVAQLSDPVQLWETAYGRSIIYKVALLGPIGFLALRNRRVVAALRGVAPPNQPTLRIVRKGALLELALALIVVVVASVLVGQVPGRV